MERALTSFIRALRTAGAAVSTAEAIDAARAIDVIGYRDRQSLKHSLGIVLAKSEDEKRIHDQLFELYFNPAAAARPPAAQAKPQPRDGEQSEQSEQSDAQSAPQPQGAQSQPGGGGGDPQPGQGGQPQGGGGGDPTDALVELAQSGDADRMAMVMERAAAAVGADEIRFASQTAYFVRRMLQELGIESLEARLLDALRDPSEAAQARAQELIDARATLARQARAHVDRRFEVFGRNATEAFLDDVVLNRAIEQLGPRDMERMRAVVARMAKRLAVRHQRRRKLRNRSQLDLRRTLRSNAGNDGVPFNLIWKLKRTEKPKIVTICDVSGSVAQYVRFLLLFLYALHEGVADLEAYAFSARLEDVGEDLRSFDPDLSMRRIIDRVGGGSTDYGQALADLRENHWETIDRRTTVLVLGDGRSNYGDLRLDLFEEIADRAKRVVWLCPEPPGRWGSGDSGMLRYRPFCNHLIHCATAADLEKAMDEVLLAYE
jgi:uncharacterized protein with von Willebrand factor type A (vWA) domain